MALECNRFGDRCFHYLTHFNRWMNRIYKDGCRLFIVGRSNPNEEKYTFAQRVCTEYLQIDRNLACSNVDRSINKDIFDEYASAESITIQPNDTHSRPSQTCVRASAAECKPITICAAVHCSCDRKKEENWVFKLAAARAYLHSLWSRSTFGQSNTWSFNVVFTWLLVRHESYSFSSSLANLHLKKILL